MCHQTVKVHLPNSQTLACPACGESARTFTYRRTKLREQANDVSGLDGTPRVREDLPGGSLFTIPRKVASVRTWRWTCNCGKVVQVENRIDLGPNGERGPVVETVTVNDPMVTEGMFGDAPIPTAPEGAKTDAMDQAGISGTFLDRDGAH